MSQYDFVKIQKITTEKAEKLIQCDSPEDIIDLFESYSSSFKQLTQALDNINDKSALREEIDFSLKIHERVEERLELERGNALSGINSELSRESLRSKYNSDDPRPSFLNRKT